MPIQILPPDVANEIAAGEVVERPASAVKELIENSLDAGATEIRVEVREGGRRLIRVQDNGCGIPGAETGLLFQRHATSKLRSADDLDHLGTLGFRGEALASIGSVAQVSLLSLARDETAGTLLRVNTGQEIGRELHASAPGTTITVEHLFANIPARLKFLKQAATEAGHVYQIVTRYALAYPERRFSLVSDGKLAFQSTGSGKLYDVLVKVYGLDVAQQLIPVGARGESANDDQGIELSSSPVPSVRVTGYAGIPALHRSNRNYITLFVNRRWFQDNSLAYGVIQAYHTLLPVGRYPLALIFIEMDPADVDVNVHPTKAEVRFRDSHALFSAVQRAVRTALTENAPIPSAGLGAGPGAAPAPVTDWPVQLSWDDPAAWAVRRQALLAAGSGQTAPVNPPGQGGGAEGAAGPGDPGQAAGAPYALQVPAANSPAMHGLPAVPEPGRAGAPLIPLLRVVGQLAATYIVAEGPDGMYLIDQHAAHERILYEQMLAQQSAQRVPVQPLLAPLVLELSPEQSAVVAANRGPLAELGVEIEPFGGTSYLVRALPSVLSADNPQSALSEIIDGMMSEADLVAQTREARLVTLICKRAAIKGGKVLTMTEMQEMVRLLEGCRAPRTCPHGRPTMIHVSAGELARQFGRT